MCGLLLGGLRAPDLAAPRSGTAFISYGSLLLETVLVGRMFPRQPRPSRGRIAGVISPDIPVRRVRGTSPHIQPGRPRAPQAPTHAQPVVPSRQDHEFELTPATRAPIPRPRPLTHAQPVVVSRQDHGFELTPAASAPSHALLDRSLMPNPWPHGRRDHGFDLTPTTRTPTPRPD